MGSVPDVLRRIDAFCDAVPRHWAGATDHGPLRLFTRTGPGRSFYARPVPDGPPVLAADVGRVRARQRELGVAEAFEWVHAASPSMEDAVRGCGLPVLVCPLLVLDGPPLPVARAPGFSVRMLGPVDGDLRAAAHAADVVVHAAFGAPAPRPPGDAAIAGLRADLAEGMVARVLITDIDGRAVAAGSAQRAGNAVELVGIGTAADFRRRGLGAAVTAVLAAAAHNAGADLVFLAAGDATATRVYERIGFRRVGKCGVAEPSPP